MGGHNAAAERGFRQKLRRLAKREGVNYDNVYDWTIRRFSEIE